MITAILCIAAVAAGWWAWRALRSAEHQWRQHEDESAAPEGWDAVRQFEERRKAK